MAVPRLLLLLSFVVSFLGVAKSQGLLDLNVPDNSTIGYSNEYLDTDAPVFLFDPNNTNFSSFSISPSGGNWTNIYLVTLNDVESIEFELDINAQSAENAGRIESRTQFAPSRVKFFAMDPRIAAFGIELTTIFGGMIISPSNLATGFSEEEVRFVLYSIVYIARDHPGFDPMEYCIVAQDTLNFTTACLSLYFIGRNDDPPVINFVPDTNPQFIEGQSDFVPVVNGMLMVSDADHPTRYLMMSATATLVDSSSLEELTVFYCPVGLSCNFEDGVLTVSGNETTDEYSATLSTLAYRNNMTEPIGTERTIRLVVNDGIHSSDPVDITVDIINVNDPPVISLDGTVAMVTNASVVYTEGSGQFRISRLISVSDSDPDAMIRRATINLTNIADAGFEAIALTANLTTFQLNLTTNTNRYLEVSGLATPQDYTAVLRSLVYSHGDASPGNPSPSPARVILFTVEDETGVTNVDTTALSLTVSPVNDPPILSLVNDPAQRPHPLVLDGNTEATFDYLEDDPALLIGGDIYLRDVDSDIATATLFVSGLSNGPQDRVFFTELNGLVISTMEHGGGNRTVTLSGVYSPEHYEMVLQTLSYENSFMNNTVTDGRRTVTMVTQDTAGGESDRIMLNVDVMDRNDGPQINIGQGVNMDHMITAIENGDSIPITQTFLTALADEEGHNISRLTVQLVALNGKLDVNEFLFFRTPGGIDFIPHIDEPFSRTRISIAVNSSVEIYEQALRSLFYINTELEPTRYNSSNGTDLLQRAIIIEVTDSNFIAPGTDPVSAQDADMGVTTTRVVIGIAVEPRNDNRPRILINSSPDSCSTDSDDFSDTESSLTRRRRDVRSVSRIRKRSATLNYQDQQMSMSPQIVSAVPTFIESGNPSTKCLQGVTIAFNSNTSTPLVEVSAKFSELLTFDPPELENYDKFGVWLDHRTLQVRFLGDCAEVATETTSGRARPIFIAFEAAQGDCDYTSNCNNGLCFYNASGCPLVGYIPISSDPIDPSLTNVVATETKPAISHGSSWSRLSLVVALSVVVLVVALFVVTGFTSACKNKSSYQPQHAKAEKTGSTNHIEDLVVVTMDEMPKQSHLPKDPKTTQTNQSNPADEKLAKPCFKKSTNLEHKKLTEKKANEEVPKVKRKPGEEAKQGTISCDQSRDRNSREHSSRKQTVQNADSAKL